MVGMTILIGTLMALLLIKRVDKNNSCGLTNSRIAKGIIAYGLAICAIYFPDIKVFIITKDVALMWLATFTMLALQIWFQYRQLTANALFMIITSFLAYFSFPTDGSDGVNFLGGMALASFANLIGIFLNRVDANFVDLFGRIRRTISFFLEKINNRGKLVVGKYEYIVEMILFDICLDDLKNITRVQINRVVVLVCISLIPVIVLGFISVESAFLLGVGINVVALIISHRFHCHYADMIDSRFSKDEIFDMRYDIQIGKDTLGTLGMQMALLSAVLTNGSWELCKLASKAYSIELNADGIGFLMVNLVTVLIIMGIIMLFIFPNYILYSYLTIKANQ